MKTTKLTVKFFLIISLFASIALADDGQMGGGGFTGDGQTGGGYTCNADTDENCPDDEGQMGGGGYAEEGQMGGGGFADPVLVFVKDYLAKLLG